MAEHAATTTAAATTAHFAPVAEEVAAAVAAAERPRMAFVVSVEIRAFAVAESMAVMVAMEGMGKQLAHAHDGFRYIVEVT
ncbi:hypothetical protein [Rhodanobacter umsongensis]